MRKGHNIIITMPWLYLELNGRQLRIDSEDSLNIYIWREYKTKPNVWFKIKTTLVITEKTGYKRYVINVSGKYLLSRVVYKAHNPEWDITDTSSSNEIDHININSLDNRIENLRVLNHQKNMFNTETRNGVKIKGYNWDKKRNKWRAQIVVNSKNIFLGRFTEKADAHQAYLTAKEKYHLMPI